MTNMNTLTAGTVSDMPTPKETEQIDIDFLLSDVMIIKAESLKDRKIFKYAEYLERQLLIIKNIEAVLDLGVPLK